MLHFVQIKFYSDLEEQGNVTGHLVYNIHKNRVFYAHSPFGDAPKHKKVKGWMRCSLHQREWLNGWDGRTNTLLRLYGLRKRRKAFGCDILMRIVILKTSTKNPIFLISEVEYLTHFTKISKLKCFQHLKRVSLRILQSKSLSTNLFTCISVQSEKWMSLRELYPNPPLE